MTTASGILASIASITAALVNLAGTKTTVTLAPVASMASATDPKTGTRVPESNSTFWPPLPGVTPPTMLVPAVNMSCVCLRPSEPVMPWTMTLESALRKIATVVAAFQFVLAAEASSAALRAAPSMVSSTVTRGCPNSARMRRPSSTLLPSSRTTSGLVASSPRTLRAPTMPLATWSQAVLAGRSELLAGVGDDIQCRHDQSSAVADDAHGPVEPYVVQVLGLGCSLERVGRSLVLERLVVGVTEAGVVVERHLAVKGDDPAVGGPDQRVDLDQRRVLVAVDGPQLLHGLGDLALDVLVEVGRVDDLFGFGCVDAHDRVDGDTGECLGTLDGEHLDLHAALFAGHREVGAVGAVEQDREVVLLRDLRAGGDHHLVDRVALDVHTENLSGGLSRVLGRLGDLDPTGLATSTDLDLRLDDDHSAAVGADRLCRGAGFFNGLGDGSSQHGHTVRFEHVARLVFEKIHEFILIVEYGNVQAERSPRPCRVNATGC